MKYVAFVRGGRRFRYENTYLDSEDYRYKKKYMNPPSEEELIADFNELENPLIYVVPPDDECLYEHCFVIYKVLVNDDAQSGSESVDKMWLLGAKFSSHRIEFLFSKKANYLCDLPCGGEEFLYDRWDEKIYEVFLAAISAYRGGVKGILTRHWSDRAASLYSDIVDLSYDSQSIFNRCMNELDDLMCNTNIKTSGDYFALLMVLLEYFQTIYGAESINESSKDRLEFLQSKQMLICGIEQIRDDMPRTLYSLFFDSEKTNRLNEMIYATMRAKDSETLQAIYENIIQTEKVEAQHARMTSSL